MLFAMLGAAVLVTAVPLAASDTTLEAALEKSRVERVAQERPWQLLLHYRPSAMGVRSEADGAGFFFAPSGVTDPRAELEASLRAMFAPVAAFAADPSQHPRCRFPARFSFFLERLALSEAAFAPLRCERFERWRQALDVEAVTLIFASAFLNNPASMYGHTLLRLDRRGAPAGTEMLSHILNYSAEATTDNGFAYMVLGLTGGFAGKYAVMPYYVKIQEYGNLEHRDLWEYRLSLSPAAIERLVAHAWEMGSTHFDYFFLTENCSYHLLSLLEAAEPSLHLTARFGGAVLPIDTIRAVLEQPGLVRERRFRPSREKLLRARVAELTSGELSLVKAIAADPTSARGVAVEQLPPLRRAHVLEAAYELFTHDSGWVVPNEDPASLAAAQRARLREEGLLLSARSRIELASAPPTVPAEAPPEEGHLPSSVALGFGIRGGENFQELRVRPALHDLLSAPEGYAPGSQLEMASLRLRFDVAQLMGAARLGADPVQLERLDVVRITSLSPLEPLMNKPSWRFSFGLRSPRDAGCRELACLQGGAEGGVGVALELPPFTPGVFFALAEVNVAAGPALRSGHRVGAGPSAGLWLRPHPLVRILGEAGYRYDFLGDDSLGAANFRVQVDGALQLGARVELRLGGARENGHEETLLSVLVHHG